MAPFALPGDALSAAPGPRDRTRATRSVHLCAYPEAEDARMDPRLEVAVDRMQQVILLGRQAEPASGCASGGSVIHRDGVLLDDIRALEVEQQELNVKEIATAR